MGQLTSTGQVHIRLPAATRQALRVALARSGMRSMRDLLAGGIVAAVELYAPEYAAAVRKSMGVEVKT